MRTKKRGAVQKGGDLKYLKNLKHEDAPQDYKSSTNSTSLPKKPKKHYYNKYQIGTLFAQPA